VRSATHLRFGALLDAVQLMTPEALEGLCPVVHGLERGGVGAVEAMAAVAAHADHFIRTLPDGYNTVLNEEASNISQGQRQLLAIQAHRGAYKTTAVTEIGSIRNFLLHPDDRVALVRETWSGANDSLKTIGLYMEHELIQELFRAFHGFYPEKIVNRDGAPQPVRIEFNGLATVDAKGQAVTLSAGSPDDTNSIAEPTKVVPTTTTIDVPSRSFTHTCPPYSITVLQMRAR